MSSYLIPIKIAFIIFSILGFFLILPWLIYSYRKYGYFSLWASIVAYSFIFYMLSALFLVLLPLPDTRDTCSSQLPNTVHYSLVPFYFIWDVINSSSVVWSQPSTYIQIFKQSAFLQATFNFLLLLPFGVYLRYFFKQKRYWKKALGLGIVLSLFYEITQVTGIYGIYNCAYRIFDVDDLILNSTGTLFGFLIGPVILALFPSRKSLIDKGERLQESHFTPPLSQLVAVIIDYLLISLSWNLTAGLFTTNGFFEFIYATIGFFIFYFVVPLFGQGKTIGTNIMRFKLIKLDRKSPMWQSLLKRSIAIYFPWVATWSLKFFNSIDLDMNSNFYLYHALITVAVLVFVVILWAVLFIHVVYILFKKGKRTFYFDYLADLIPRRK
ncbi:VanZ family protein [Paucisalibacillus sp. EB02]|uniref:VanZ family protein n=1 Tax=Paucisalibacillus sp. EB02 TaxID=1347087 RepID=UPI0005AB233D|nr:VanZ family protein [Paucisalibacillus sp. EB02]